MFIPESRVLSKHQIIWKNSSYFVTFLENLDFKGLVMLDKKQGPLFLKKKWNSGHSVNGRYISSLLLLLHKNLKCTIYVRFFFRLFVKITVMIMRFYLSVQDQILLVNTIRHKYPVRVLKSRSPKILFDILPIFHQQTASFQMTVVCRMFNRSFSIV
mgnify:CR=1 FL=1